MKILVVGAGAVGGFFGSHLHRHGVDVDWLVRPARKKQIANCLTVRLPNDVMSFHPALKTKTELCTEYDLIILTNKAYSLDSVLSDIHGVVRSDTMILPLLNGLAHLEKLDATFSRAQVLGGIAKTIATLHSPSEIQVFNNASSMTIGARSQAQDRNVASITRLFSEAGITIDNNINIMAAMWDKFCRMAAIGAANCLLKGTVSDYMRSEEGGDIALKLFEECTSTAAASGFPMQPSAITSFQRTITNPDSSFSSSMYRDLCAGLPVEGEHLVGDMLARAKSFGISCEYLIIANAVLQTYSARKMRSSPAI